MPLPKKISPCPIIDTTLEIRFKSLMPAEAIFGVIYEKFNKTYPQTEKLPVLQIPEEIRNHDQNLIFQPHYRLKNDKFIISVGPRIIAFGLPGEYVGWSEFSSESKSMFTKVKKLNILNKIDRLGLRYVNFFDGDIFEKTKLTINLDNAHFLTEQTHYRATIKSSDFSQILQIVNNASVNKNSKISIGSIVDIDTSIERTDSSIYAGLNDFIEDAHSVEKKLFYSLLKDDFIATLNPEY